MALAAAFSIGDSRIANGAPPFVIAEAGSNFDQSLQAARRLFDAHERCRVEPNKTFIPPPN